MFQSPIGGVSFLANLLIIAIASILKPFKASSASRCYIVTQEDISGLEQSRVGRIFSRVLAFTIPVAISFVLVLLMFNILLRLYHDENRMTVLDLGSRAVGIITELGMAQGVSSDVERSVDNEQENEVASSSEQIPQQVEEVPSVNIDEPFFREGRDVWSLTDFFQMNGVFSSFDSRAEFAHFFAIDEYSETARQNEELVRTPKA
jgi:uncharacterized membrane protein